MNNFSIEQANPLVWIVRIDYDSDLEQDFLLTSDHHFDSKYCRRDVLKEDLEEAKKREAGTLVFGDVFDIMQSRHDPRRAKSDLREEYKQENYLDLVREDAVDFYGPYKDQLMVMGKGNHETSVTKNTGTDMMDNLVKDINRDFDGDNIYAGGYQGWLFFRFERKGGGGRFTKKLKFHHGSGGSAPVTKGTLKASRRGLVHPDADIFCTGHIHEQWYFPIERNRITANGNPYYDKQIHLQLPSYKRDDGESGPKTLGWSVEREFSPQPIGGWWLKFRFQGGKLKIKTETTQ